jgi:murein L,D-transpeptidase YcbB/YkuD
MRRLFEGMSVALLAGACLASPLDAAPQGAPAPARLAPPKPAPPTPTPPRLIPIEPVPALVTPPPPPPRVFPKLTAAQRSQLEAMLGDSAAQGLSHGPADAKAPVGALDNDALIVAALQQAQAVRAGRLDSSDFRKDWGLRPVRRDPWPSFSEALAQDRLKTWIADLPPPYVGYDGLRKGLAAYRTIEANGGWQTLAAGPDLTIGAKGERVAALRKRLRIEDKALTGDSATFDQALLDAVRRAQRRYGLNPSGVVSSQTLAALNVSAGDRVRQIMANMERWRWLPQTLAPVRVQVNIAAAVLTVFDGDTPVASMRAVTGRPGDETPMLQSSIHSIVINPPWNVPTSIATRELWPKERASPGYLKRNGFKVIPLADGGNRLQQAAGTQSALGRLKFDFDNAFSVYLHDTPSQSTFARYSRLASHGCVRLEKPLALANLLLKGDPKWGDGGVEAAIAKGDTVRARLPQPVAVYLFYWTAFASADGQMNFRADPYDWDGILASKIEARGRLAAR